MIQRIRFSFDVTFDNPLVTPFPGNGATPYDLTATFTTNGTTVPGANSQDTVEFELVAGADPYFSNIDPADSAAVSWLSQDLRVFTITKGESALPGDPAAPTFLSTQITVRLHPGPDRLSERRNALHGSRPGWLARSAEWPARAIWIRDR